MRRSTDSGVAHASSKDALIRYSSCELQGHRVNPFNDEHEKIKITCPDNPDGTPMVFMVHKSILKRSPTLKRFFKSRHYLPGCEMHLALMLDPAACVKIALLYLTKGPDIFNQQCIDIGVDAYPEQIDRFQVLIRLYLLATNLKLPHLADMAYQGLLDRELPMLVGYTIVLASLVFREDVKYDTRIRSWCMRHLTKYVQHLKTIPQWLTLLPTLEEEFRERWDKQTKATNPRFSWPVDESKLPPDTPEPDSDEEIIQEVVKESKMPGFNMHHRFKDPVTHKHQNSDADWENRKSEIIGAYVEGGEDEYRPRLLAPHRSRSKRAISWLHFSPHKNKGTIKRTELDMTWANEFAGATSPELVKAVHMLGMNDLGGTIISHSKPGRATRVLFKLHHVMD